MGKNSLVDIMRAHQFLYYVLSCPIWTDYEYDQFCSRNNLNGSGGSDLTSDYEPKIIALATDMFNHPPLYSPELFEKQ